MTERSAADINADEDYRQSHLERGGSYDHLLASNPFDRYMAQQERNFLNEVLPALFPSQQPRCIDFACGTGRITHTLISLSSETVGVDISPSMLAEARKKCPSARFVHTDLTQSKVDLGTFDVVSSFRFFGNAQQELRTAVLPKLNQLLNIGGYLIINSHRNPHSLAAIAMKLAGSEHGMDLHYFKLKRLLRLHGFEITRKRPIGAWMYRSRVMSTEVSAARSKSLEWLFGHPVFAPIAPDTVIVAKKVRTV